MFYVRSCRKWPIKYYIDNIILNPNKHKKKSKVKASHWLKQSPRNALLYWLPSNSAILSKVTKILVGDLNWWKFRPYFNGASSKALTFTSRFVIWQFWHLIIGEVMVYDLTEDALRYLLSTLLQYVGIMVTLPPFFWEFLPLVRPLL